MAAGDVSAILDLASAPEVSAPTPIPSPEPTPEPSSASSEPSLPPTAESETPSEGAEPSPEAGAEPEPKVDGRTNPAAIRSALKAFRDSKPENAPLARELNDGYGRYLAYRDTFPTVTEARNVKAFIDANGGIEGLTGLHETIKSVSDTDQLLYAGDPKVLDSIIEDMRSEGKLDSFTKLAGPFFERAIKINPEGAWTAFRPYFYQGFTETGVPNYFDNLLQALSGEKPDIEGAKGMASQLVNWYKKLGQQVEQADKSKLDPDRQAFEKEKNDFLTQKQQEFRSSVGSAADSYSNTSLGGALKPFLKLPFFKNLATNQKAMLSLAKEIKSTLLDELGADKTYQSQMNAFFSSKTPDKSKITQYHNAKVDTLAKRIVQSVIETRYPDYSKRAVAPSTRQSADTPAPTPDQSRGTAPGKPEFVKAKPEWDQIDWSRDPEKLLFISGRAFLKTGKFVAWGKKYSPTK